MPGQEHPDGRDPDAVTTHVVSTLHDLIALSDREAELDGLAQILAEALVKAQGLRQGLSGR